METPRTSSQHTTGPITVHPFKDNISQGFEVRVTSEGVPDCPLARFALKADAQLFVDARALLDQVRALVVQIEAARMIVPPNLRALLDRIDGASA